MERKQTRSPLPLDIQILNHNPGYGYPIVESLLQYGRRREKQIRGQFETMGEMRLVAYTLSKALISTEYV